MATTFRSGTSLWLVLAIFGFAGPAAAVSPSPLGTAGTPAPSPSATAPTATRTPPRPTITATRLPDPNPTTAPVAATDGDAARQDPTDAPAAPVATAAAPRTRAFRTPERAAPPVFVAPDGAASEVDGSGAPEPAARGQAAPAARPGGTGLVVFRMTARTAIEGFDLRVAYPRSLGMFATSGQAADCNAGTGALVAASDRGNGELRLLVAAAQPLPFPLDVFCRFSTAPGAGLDAGAFEVRIAEVTSDAKRADSSLLIVNVAVR